MDIDWSLVLTLLLVAAALFAFSGKRRTYAVVSELVFYPVKGCAGVNVQSAKVTETGIRFDRYWAVLDQHHELVNLKSDPRLMRVEPELLLNAHGEVQTLILRYVNKEFRLQVDPHLSSPAFEVTMSRHSRLVRSEGATEFFREALQAEYILVRLAEVRPPHSDFKSEVDAKVGLVSATQFHITAEESLEELHRRLPDGKKRVHMSAFRPNIVIRGAPAYDEDTWRTFSIGSLQFLSVKPCKRCVQPTIDPDTLQFDPAQEPIATLRKTHGIRDLPMFGVVAVKRNEGIVTVGDRVVVASRQPFAY